MKIAEFKLRWSVVGFILGIGIGLICGGFVSSKSAIVFGFILTLLGIFFSVFSRIEDKKDGAYDKMVKSDKEVGEIAKKFWER